MNALTKQPPEKRREPGFVELAIGNGDHGVVERVRRSSRSVDSSEFEAKQRGADPGALVAGEESLRLRDVESLGCRNPEDIRAAVVKIILRLRDGALQARLIANPLASTVLTQRAPVQFEHHLRRQENDLSHRRASLLRQSPKQLAMFLKHRIQRGGNVRIRRLRDANLRLRPAHPLTQIRGQFFHLRQFGGRERAQGFFDFSDRHAAKLAHGPLLSNPDFPR